MRLHFQQLLPGHLHLLSVALPVAEQPLFWLPSLQLLQLAWPLACGFPQQFWRGPLQELNARACAHANLLIIIVGTLGVSELS